MTIWWCEGTKLRKDKRWKNSYVYAIEVINSDPNIIKIFKDFLRRDLKVPNSKLKGQIQIHKGDNLNKIENYWSKILKLPKSQFNKTIIRPNGKRIRKNNGTFKLRVYDKKLFLRLENMKKNELSLLDF